MTCSIEIIKLGELGKLIFVKRVEVNAEVKNIILLHSQLL